MIAFLGILLVKVSIALDKQMLSKKLEGVTSLFRVVNSPDLSVNPSNLAGTTSLKTVFYGSSYKVSGL